MPVFEMVRAQVMRIPKGYVSTYGNVAAAAGINNPRVVGFAIYNNPHPEIIPCHRVIQKSGHLAPKFSLGGIEVQCQKLLAEGVVINNNVVNMSRCFWDLTFQQRQIAIVIFFDKDNNVYLQDRRLHNKVGEKYGFWGGGIELGETPDVAIRRELTEEINYVPRELNYWKQDIFNLQDYYPVKDPYKVVLHIFHSEVNSSIINLPTHEGDGWIKVSLTKALVWNELDAVDRRLLSEFNDFLLLNSTA